MILLIVVTILGGAGAAVYFLGVDQVKQILQDLLKIFEQQFGQQKKLGTVKYFRCVKMLTMNNLILFR